VTDGGRVLCVSALGESIPDAIANAYAGVDLISWKDMTYRRDIGWRAIDR
jgi:phosphoribosylamine--glycine ligase